MPDFTYRGASGGSAPGLYPMLRDSYGALIGTAEPGDVARFEAAPDADWELYGGGGGNRGGIESEPDPADVPAASDSDDEAGVTGEED